MTALKLRPEIEELGGNLIRDISLFGRRFENTIPLWFGEADSDTSPEIVAAAVDALTAGLVRYQPNQGYSPLVSALSEYMTRLYRPIDQDRILVTVGGMNALVLCTQAVVPSGGKVVTIGPYWPNLTAIARIGGAKVEYSNLIFNGRDWVLDLDHLLSLIDASTDALLINSPANPTGWVATEAELSAIAEHCRRTKTWIISDEVYGRFYYDKADRAPSLLDVASDDDRLLVVNSFSKSWKMTGWRVGWITLPPGLLSKFCQLNEYNVAGPTAFAQAGALEALREESNLVQFVNDCRSSRDLVTERLNAIPGVSCANADGAFYAFFRISGATDSVKLAQDLIQRAGVGLAPGAAFGPAGEGWLRLCYAQKAARVSDALDRLEHFLKHPDVPRETV